MTVPETTSDLHLYPCLCLNILTEPPGTSISKHYFKNIFICHEFIESSTFYSPESFVQSNSQSHQKQLCLHMTVFKECRPYNPS